MYIVVLNKYVIVMMGYIYVETDTY